MVKNILIRWSGRLRGVPNKRFESIHMQIDHSSPNRSESVLHDFFLLLPNPPEHLSNFDY